MSKTNMRKPFEFGPLLYVATVVVIVLLAGLGKVAQAHMEAKAFSKLTGRTDVTWWDAMWVNLRVDD